MKHTPEPWNVRERDDDVQILHSHEHVLTIGPDEIGEDSRTMVLSREARENARRIVACVNACAGIPTEELEACLRNPTEFLLGGPPEKNR